MSNNPRFETVPGFKVATAAARIKNWKRNDMGLVVADGPAAAAGVFTQSNVVAAPVTLNRKHLDKSGGYARAILVNAGCANACTGDEGKKNARACAKMVAEGAAAESEEVLLCSTGVIGRQLPMENMTAGIQAAFAGLGKAKPGDFAKAIMTTDTKPKEASAVVIGLDDVVLVGVCKGSGMIAPNMATMLAFILTNAAAEPKVLRAALSEVAKDSFNAVTVDGDTSTNDTCLLLASGRTKADVLKKASGRRYDLFLTALHGVCQSLARQIAQDGEGATKMAVVRVVGAKSDSDARKAARTIAESPLVKTALYGNDPNWGRVIMALGRSGVKMDEETTSLTMCGKEMFVHGAPVEFDAAALSAAMRAKEIELLVDMGVGEGSARMFTCDYSTEYIKINADYTT